MYYRNGDWPVPLEDGEYLLSIGGVEPMSIYCAGMIDAFWAPPKEYISLHRTSGANFSQYAAGGGAPGTNVVTQYTKVRFYPVDLVIDISDKTFATSTGSVQLDNSPLTSVSFGSAGSCNLSASGVANIDLRGTQFTVRPGAFTTSGYQPSGTAAYSANNQVVDLTGGGFCGSIGPVTWQGLSIALQIVYSVL